MNILVTDGENRSALAVTRSFGRKGCNVFVAGAATGNLSAASRFCKKSYITPNPLTEGKRYAEEVSAIAVKEKIDVIFPMTEQSIYQLNKVRDQLPGNIVLACALSGPMEAVSNKFHLFQVAQSIGVPIPETIFVDGVEDFWVKEPSITVFPVVVKPAFSKIVAGDEVIATGVMYASSRAEMIRLYETVPALRHPSLVQELIIGEGTGLFTLFDVDRHLALFSHQRLLEKPPSGGVSVLSQSVALDPEMVQSAQQLLAAVGWKGVAMVEFKRDVRDGRAKLMEINGRFWGSLQLAVSAGVDFPALYLDYCLDKKPTALSSDYRVGHRLKWFFGILDHLIIRLKHGDLGREVPPGFPASTNVIWELLKGGDGRASFDVIDFEDMKPFMAEVKFYLQKSLVYRK